MSILNTKFREFHKINCNKNEKCQEYLTLFKKMKGKAQYILTHSIIMKNIERKIIDEFLKENDISMNILILMLIWRDGILSDELANALVANIKRSNHDYFYLNNFTFEYKKPYDIDDWDKVFDNDENTHKKFNLYYPISQRLKEYYKNNGYNSLTQYIKTLLADFNIYPQGSYNALQKYVRTDFVINPDKKHLRDLKSDRKRQAKRRTRRQLTNDDEKINENVLIYITKFEKIELIDPFIKYIKDIGLSLSQIVKYELYKSGLINIEDTALSKHEIKMIEYLNYKVKPAGTSKFYYENGQNASKDKKTTVRISFPNDKELLKKMKGKTGSLFKYFVLRKYGVYPVLYNFDIADLFINYNKIYAFLDRDDAKKEQITKK